MAAETGINKLLEVLDELCLKGEVSLAYELMSLLKNLLDQLLLQSMIILFILKDFTIRQKGIKWKYMMGC